VGEKGGMLEGGLVAAHTRAVVRPRRDLAHSAAPISLSSTFALRSARRCAEPAAAWRRSVACAAATCCSVAWRCSVAYSGARWHTAVLGGAQRPRRRGGARVTQQRFAALGGIQRRSAAASACGSAAVLGSTWHSRPWQRWFRYVVALGGWRSAACRFIRRNSVARGGTRKEAPWHPVSFSGIRCPQLPSGELPVAHGCAQWF